MSTIDKASLIQIPSGYKNGKLYSVKPNPSYGSELVTNGGFDTDSDWTKETGWTISGGKANFNTTSNSTISQNLNVTSGVTYRIQINGQITSGGLKLSNGSGLGNDSAISLPLDIYYTHDGGTNDIQIRTLGASVGYLENVSVTEVIVADGDFDFSRSSSATRVNSEGLIETAQVVSTTELVTNGDFATDSDWNKLNGSTISGGVGNMIAGGNVEAGTANWSLNQDTVFSANKKYQVNFRARQTSGSGNFQAARDYYTFIDQAITSSFVDYSFIVDSGSLNFTGNLVFGGRTSGDEFEIDNVSVKEVIENDVPRLDYSGGASCASLLLEPQSTNTVTYSDDFSQWTLGGLITPTLTSGQLSPSGEYNATKISGTIGSSILYIPGTTTTTATRSIYAKTVSGTGTARLMSYYSNTNNLFTLTEEWQRFELTGSSLSGGTNFYIDFRDSAQTLNEFIIWGAQSEELSYATSYIPSNSGSSTTRTADVCNNAGTSATFNSTEGVLFAEIAALANDGTNRTIALNKDTNDRIQMYFNTSTNGLSIFYKAQSGTTSFIMNETLTDATSFNKIAFKWKANDFALWVNGVETDTVSSGVTPTANSLNTLEFEMFNDSSSFYGKTKQLMTFNEALSDEELSDLTGQANLSFNNLATFYGYTIL